ncbi:hypothetical protein [Wenzhouxiangella marina]|uniref:Uncharacterized protein n=1 Tax=Wenzhouxiangella marina TaxID=1579979 RepID=A0A0K0XYX7_9GAMM|nr:hypothetical protein [Wenzhouxiangella marina]AKS42875.1 hypothetical protein WM2015_2517 [Wenzhouxiangella marina]MBB6087443.1 hypothetical protein [Wenzhouxiangella marina]
MLLEFIAAIAVGLGTAGLILTLNVLSGKRLPGWLMPAAAGLAMIGFMVYMEYSWADRTLERLPEGVALVSRSEERMWYRPWTYARPLSLRMVALDTRRSRRHESRPDWVMTSVLLLGRWMPVREIPVVFDCEGNRRADLHEGVSFGDSGELIGAEWRPLPSDHPALRIACARVTTDPLS